MNTASDSVRRTRQPNRLRLAAIAALALMGAGIATQPVMAATRKPKAAKLNTVSSVKANAIVKGFNGGTVIVQADGTPKCPEGQVLRWEQTPPPGHYYCAEPPTTTTTTPAEVLSH